MFFSFFSKHVVEQKKMVHLNKNSFTPAQKIDLEDSLNQPFVTLSKLLTFRYICGTSEGRRHSRNFALSNIYKIYFRLFTEAAYH